MIELPWFIWCGLGLLSLAVFLDLVAAIIVVLDIRRGRRRWRP